MRFRFSGILLLTLGALPSAWATAQEESSKPKSVPALLIASPAGQVDEVKDVAKASEEDSVEILSAEYASAMASYREAMQNAETDEARTAARELRPNPDDYAPKFWIIANDSDKGNQCAKALVWIFSNVRSDQEKALKSVVENHLKSPDISGLLMPAAYASIDAASPALEKLMGSPHRPIQGLAHFALATRLKRNKESPERVEELFAKILADYADIEDPRRGTPLGDVAKKELFEARNLAIGKTAPDIEGVDTDQVEFKLSDYRGKVVLLDFWGHW